jgi:hypothetical protein
MVIHKVEAASIHQEIAPRKCIHTTRCEASNYVVTSYDIHQMNFVSFIFFVVLYSYEWNYTSLLPKLDPGKKYKRHKIHLMNIIRSYNVIGSLATGRMDALSWCNFLMYRSRFNFVNHHNSPCVTSTNSPFPYIVEELGTYTWIMSQILCESCLVNQIYAVCRCCVEIKNKMLVLNAPKFTKSMLLYLSQWLLKRDSIL